ncbi:TonB-dependent receptor [Paracnuella aquatica]|uniref:TonB-dependent receptor n=1 Tax=Paracnuella aquatica TaxID=2268757 RepID=UPI000DEFE45C|nr:TonB-dependent receptor [Paracnuella aquatica]RPD51966.1 TonB-dependent receptor [Paracnuella aquatica]
MIKLLNLVFLCCLPAAVFAQFGAKIWGTVIDGETGLPLAGASVTVKGSELTVTTDRRGHFSISKPEVLKQTLVFSFVGYEEIERTLREDETNIHVALTMDTKLGHEVVVSASRRAEKITAAPASIQVIGKTELNEFAGSNFGELLSKVQGIEMTQSGMDETMFNARGFNNAFNNKILQLADGRNMMTPLSGGLPMLNKGSIIKEDIERLEVVLGPQSALYGPNAHNAVFNFITKDPRKYGGTTLAASAGNRSQFSARLRHAMKLNDRWAFKVTGEHVTGRDFKFFDSVYVPLATSDRSVPERNVDFDFRHIRGEGHIYYSLTPFTDIVVSGGGSTNDYLQVTTTMRNQMKDLTYRFLQARIVNPRYYVTVYNSWGNIGNSYLIANYTRDFWTFTNQQISADSAERRAKARNLFKEESQRLNADAQYNHHFKTVGLFVVGGVNFQKERPNGFGVNLVDSFKRIEINQYGAVLQLEQKLPMNTRFIGALRWDHHSNFGNVYAPKFGLVKTVGDGSLRITWAKAYAMPSILNQYSILNGFIFGNGEGITYWPVNKINDPTQYQRTTPLRPEEVRTWELGYKGTAARKLYTDVNGYYSRIKNFLGPPRTVAGRAITLGEYAVRHNPVFAGNDESGVLTNALFNTYFNYGNVQAWGIDAGLNYELNNTISFALKYSWFDSDIKNDRPENDANRDNEVTADENSANAPEHRALALLRIQNLFKQRLVINLSVRYVEEYDFYSGSQIGTSAGAGRRGVIMRTPPNPPLKKNFDHGALGGFTSVDVSANYRVNQQVQVNLGVTNLFNTKQVEFVGSPSIGRLIVAEIKLHVPDRK